MARVEVKWLTNDWNFVLLQGHLSYEEPLLSELGTFQLEFAYLAHTTNDDSFLLQVNHINSIVSDDTKPKTEYLELMKPL